MKSLAIVFTILIVSSSFANIRVGRTGGGLAEMKAYSVVDQISSLVKICTTSNSKCGMTDSQRNDLVSLSQRLDLNKVELLAPWSGPTKLDGFRLLINSQDLYTSGTPHKYGEILSLCLYVLLRDGLRLNESVARWPYQVFSHFQENMRSLYLPNFNFTLHFLALGIPSSNETMIQALALELPKNTLDLTEQLFLSMGCTPQSWTVETWNYTADQAWVRAQLLWTCQNHDFSGELQLQVNSTGVSRMNVVRKNLIR